MFGLEHFSFSALWSPFLMLFLLLVVCAYFLVTGPWRHRFPDSKPVSKSQKALFLFGVLLYYFAIGGPLNLLGHLIFSAHMLYMAIAYLIVPPIVLLGMPEWLLRAIFQLRWMRPVLKFMHPVVTVLLFNALFSFYHIPAIHDTILTNYVLHAGIYVVLLIAAFMMWWHVVSPLKEHRRLSELQRMAYVFAMGVLLTPACALIIFAKEPLFATYYDPEVWAQALGFCIPSASTEMLIADFGGPEYFAIFPPLDDQQLGGVIMKLIQEIMYGCILMYIFYQWFRRENPKKEDDTDENDLGDVTIVRA